MMRFRSQLAVMQSSVWSLYLQQQQLAIKVTTLGLLLVHVTLKLFRWLVGIFFSAGNTPAAAIAHSNRARST